MSKESPNLITHRDIPTHSSAGSDEFRITERSEHFGTNNYLWKKTQLENFGRFLFVMTTVEENLIEYILKLLQGRILIKILGGITFCYKHICDYFLQQQLYIYF